LKRLARWDDQESWRTFFDLYWRLIYWWALRQGLEDADAQDVVQSTVMAVARAFRENQFHYDPGVCSFKTWLRRVTDHRITDEFRRQRRRPTSPLPDLDLEETPESLMARSGSTLESAWDEEWERNLLAAAAERVKPKVNPRHFQIFEYHVLQGHGVRETAKHLNSNVAQVYLVKHRIAPLMREEVGRLRDRPL
jgi:RNA polymerase sigma-70 factor (ECF subfamily)